jgi:membrane-associated phospholipid phosphatase
LTPVFRHSWTVEISTGHSSREHISLQFPLRVVVAQFVMIALTLLTTAAGASDTGSSTALPDAPSAVLALRPIVLAEDISKTQPILLTLPFGTALSDDPAAQPEEHPSLLHRAIWDQRSIYTAPFHRRNLKWDLLFLAAAGGFIAGDRYISRAVNPDHATVSQDISDIGLYSMAASVGGLFLSSLKTQDAHARETGFLSAEAFANTAVVLSFTQLIAGRERPTEGNGNGRFWQNNKLGSSFPSAHSSFTWTLASVVAHEYPKPWVRWLVYGTATTVSVTRVTGLKHFSSDVEVGGVFGYLIGQHIFNAHCSPGLSASCHSSRKSAKAKDSSR